MRTRSALVAIALLVLAIDGTPAASSPDLVVTDPFQDSRSVSVAPVEGAVKEAFRREFGVLIEQPALFDDPRSVNCPGMGHYTATAYLRASDSTSNLLSLYLSPGAGAQVTRKSRANWPASHDWSATCGGEQLFDPFVVSPRLLGWEDVDGDRVPEILDETPYGRPRDAAVDGAR